MRIICAILISYAGFLRSQELLAIRCSANVFGYCFMSIFIEKSKTLVYRDGARVVIAKTNSKLCQVKNIMHNIQLLNIEDDYSD